MADAPTQREYWSGKVGGEWARHTAQIDVMLSGVAEATLEACAIRAGERVLDIGCGAGGTTVEIARRVGPEGAVVGLDLSPQMLDVARERARSADLPVEFLEADAAQARFPQPFDAAFSRFGVMFFDQPTAAFMHIRMTLRPGGRLAFACWRPMSENVWARKPIAAIEPMLKAPLQPPDPDAPGPYAFADANKVERILRESGWSNLALARWDGDLKVGGGGTLNDASDFLLRIGPCARAVAEQGLDAEEAKRRIGEAMAPLYTNGAVHMPAACWIVTATA